MIFADKYIWTQHSRIKMQHYHLTESRVKRVIRHPARIEEGVIENAVAAMQPAESKKYSEIWVMYVLTRKGGLDELNKKIKVITAWRYPGHAPERDPIPPEILREIKKIF